MQTDLFDAPSTALPEGLVYQPGFISAEEEAGLLAWIATLPLHAARYKAYTARRRIASFGTSYDFDDQRLLPAPPLPPELQWLRELVAAWARLPADDFHNALVAEYAPGTPLGWHRDVPDHEVVVGVSLHGSGRMRFRRHPPTRPRAADVFSLALAPRSVYVLRGEARWGWQHSIAPATELRYSITLRTPAQRRS